MRLGPIEHGKLLVKKLARVDRWRSLYDIDDELQRRALASTADFVAEHMNGARAIRGRTNFESKDQLIELGLRLAPDEGLALEFGVHTGGTLRRIAARRKPVHGFDSFEGLPESWRSGFGVGRFETKPPNVAGAILHSGWFEESLPRFLEEHKENFAFVHLDADLYSSTSTIFTEAQGRFKAGTVLLFDEYFNYFDWEKHEHKAFMEFIERTGHGFEYLAYNVFGEQVLVRLATPAVTERSK